MIDNNIPYTTRPSCCSCSCRFPFSSNGGNPGIDLSSASSSRLEYVCCILFRSRSSPCQSCKYPLKYRLIMPPPKGGAFISLQTWPLISMVMFQKLQLTPSPSSIEVIIGMHDTSRHSVAVVVDWQSGKRLGSGSLFVF